MQHEGKRTRNELDWVLEASRRARGVAVCAALRALGRTGVVEIVECCCRQGRRFAEREGRRAIRLSVSNWQTGDEETELAVDAFRRALSAPSTLAR